MKKTLTIKDILRGEKKLERYQSDSSVVWNDIIDESWRTLVNDIIVHKNQDPRRLQIQYLLTTSFVDEDYANRALFVAEPTTVSSETTITLSGANDKSDVAIEVAKLTFDKPGIYKTFFYDFYNYYKVDSTTHTSYLIEVVFEELHKMKAREYAFRDLSKNSDDDYSDSMFRYEEKYDKLFSDGNWKYDLDEDRKISEEEGDSNISKMYVARP